MICKSENESVVKLERMYFKELSCHRSGSELDQLELSMTFQKAYCFDSEKTHCTVCLGCNIHDNDNTVINIIAEICGDFICECADEVRRLVLLKENTLSILFPYLRSQISLLTSQPDMSPIVIPPINIGAVLRNAKELPSHDLEN